MSVDEAQAGETEGEGESGDTEESNAIVESQELQAFLDREKKQQKKNTYQNRQSGLKAFDQWLQITGLTVDDVNFVDIEDFSEWLTNEKGSGGISDHSANLYIQQVNLFYKRKIKEELIAESENERVKESDIITPVHNAELNLNTTESERAKHTRERERKGLSIDEMDQMIETVDSFKGQLVFKVLAGTGARPSDLQEIRVQDVDLEKSRIKIRSTKTTNSREVPISDSLKQYLNLWLNNGYRDACYYADSVDYLIPGENSEKLGRTYLQDLVTEKAEECEIQREIYTDGAGRTRMRINPKSFRVGYLTHMKDKVSPKELQYLAGHKEIETTLSYYTEVSDDDIDNMQPKVPDV